MLTVYSFSARAFSSLQASKPENTVFLLRSVILHVLVLNLDLLIYRDDSLSSCELNIMPHFSIVFFHLKIVCVFLQPLNIAAYCMGLFT